MGTYAYDRASARTYSLKLNRKTDADLIAMLDRQDNVQRYIKDLIRADLAGQKGEDTMPQSDKALAVVSRYLSGTEEEQKLILSWFPGEQGNPLLAIASSFRALNGKAVEDADRALCLRDIYGDEA